MGILKLTGFCLSILVGVTALSAKEAPEQGDKITISAPSQTGKQAQAVNWKKFHSVNGKCAVAFPEAPEHIRQNMNVPEEEVDLSYDVYVAADGKEAVYMVLIAQYPSFIDENYAELSLESFLNGILSQHPANQLVFADLIEVQGFKGMDFFVKTKGVFFKGRAIMARNHLYLLAMECEQHNYKDPHFVHFINSFELIQ